MSNRLSRYVLPVPPGASINTIPPSFRSILPFSISYARRWSGVRDSSLAVTSSRSRSRTSSVNSSSSPSRGRGGRSASGSSKLNADKLLLLAFSRRCRSCRRHCLAPCSTRSTGRSGCLVRNRCTKSSVIASE